MSDKSKTRLGLLGAAIMIMANMWLVATYVVWTQDNNVAEMERMLETQSKRYWIELEYRRDTAEAETDYPESYELKQLIVDQYLQKLEELEKSK